MSKNNYSNNTGSNASNKSTNKNTNSMNSYGNYSNSEKNKTNNKSAGENTYGEGKGDETVSDYPWLGIALYDRSIYENDMLDFSGNFSFSYSAKSETSSNELTVKLPVSLTVVYITK